MTCRWCHKYSMFPKAYPVGYAIHACKQYCALWNCMYIRWKMCKCTFFLFLYLQHFFPVTCLQVSQCICFECLHFRGIGSTFPHFHCHPAWGFFTQSTPQCHQCTWIQHAEDRGGKATSHWHTQSQSAVWLWCSGYERTFPSRWWGRKSLQAKACFLSVLLSSSSLNLLLLPSADYGVHDARHGPRLAYWRERQPERQSACYIPRAPKLEAHTEK